MPRSAAHKWGRCPCSGYYEHRQVEVRMTVDGKAIVLTDVFQGACPKCGSRVYKAEHLARIEETMKNIPLDGRLTRIRI